MAATTNANGRGLNRWRRGVVPVLTLLVLVALGARVGAALSPTPVLDWLFDNEVKATARVGNTLFVGGGFAEIAPASGRVGTLVTLAPVTGALVTAYPALSNVAFPAEMILDGAGGYYASTQTDVNGAFVGDVVHVQPDGSRDPAFTLGATVANGPNRVSATLTSASLIVSGTLQVGGVARSIAAFDRATGALLPWAPAVPANAYVMAVLASPARLFVFWNVPGAATSRLDAFDVVSGATLWQQTVSGAPSIATGGRLALAGGRLIVLLNQLRALDAASGAIDPGWGGSVDARYFHDIVTSGTAVYASNRLAPYVVKIDLASGAVVPFPLTLTALPSLAPSPTGGVFVGGPVTVAGQLRQGPVEFDAAGAVTAWTPDITGRVVGTSPNGDLVVERDAVQGLIGRPGLAAFDLTTGGLSSLGPVLGGPFVAIQDLRTDGQRVFFKGQFTAVNGQPRDGLAAIDGTSGALLAWPAADVTGLDMAAVDAGHVYFYSNGTLRRVDSTTGVLDFAWLPSVGGFMAFADGEIFIARKFPDFGVALGTLVGTLDAVTGAYRELVRVNDFVVGATPVVDGGTIYLPGNVVPRFGIPPTASAVLAIDRQTGVRVAAPPLAGPFRTLTLAGGRLVAGGEKMTVGGQYVYGAAEIARPNAKTSWDSGFRLHTGFVRGLATEAFGDLLVAAGTIGGLTGGGDFKTYSRVAAFPTTPSPAPANLRTQTSGGATLFTWDAAVPTPPGGYVIEGGFAAGQTAAALAVGNATSVALPMPPGPAFIRVRSQGSSEVSNEVVAGCLAPPLPPTGLTTTMTGTTVSFAWTGPSDAAGYTFSAGSATGLSDAATVGLPPSPTAIGGTVPGGTFFVRVAASNACGTSAPSGEVFFTVGAPDALPAAPTNLTSTVNGSTLRLSWTAPAGPVTGYVLEAGTAPGLANLGAATVGASPSFVIPTVPPGVYYRAGAGDHQRGQRRAVGGCRGRHAVARATRPGASSRVRVPSASVDGRDAFQRTIGRGRGIRAARHGGIGQVGHERVAAIARDGSRRSRSWPARGCARRTAGRRRTRWGRPGR